MDQNIFQKVATMIAGQLSMDISQITENSALRTDLGADSLDLAEIALMIKEQFLYDLSDDEMRKINTVGDICEILTTVSVKKEI